VAKSAAGGGNAYRPWLSQDGRYLVFDSDGKRVMGGTADTTAIRDVYLYDRITGTIERISVATDGSRAQIPKDSSGNCTQPQPCGSQRATISADGNEVAFWSNATNFDPGAKNGTANAYLRDRAGSKTILLSKGYNGAQPDGDSRRPVVSRDGRYVAFESAADNLVAPGQCTGGGGGGLLGGLFGGGGGQQTCTGGDSNKADDVFVYEVATGKITMVSTASDGTQGNAASNRPSISADGQEIVFQSSATNLVPGVSGAGQQIYMKNLSTGQTTLVSSDASGVPGNKASASPSISANGQFVSFDTKATNFNQADSSGDTDIYVKNLQNGAITQASVQTGGAQATGVTSTSTGGADSTISADGRWVSFWSDVNTLVPGDTNGSNCANPPCTDVFVHDMQTGTTTRITSTNGVQGDGDSYSPALSEDGRFVAIDSKANALDPAAGTTNLEKIYVHVNY
jgi:dipeptidyl aminopeptidase/acylaminoacyl peptidase